VRALFIAVVVACAHPPVPRALDAPPEAEIDRERHFTIWFGGARVGTAHETETWSRAGVVLRRTEHMSFLRGDAPVTLTTVISITADHALRPSRLSWTERGARLRHAEAIRSTQHWAIELDGALHTVDAGAIPAELIPLLIRRDGRFAGRVFLAARGFVAGDGRVDPAAPGRLVARLVIEPSTIAEATIDIDADRSYARVVDGEGVIAIRATAAQAALPFPPVDLIAATSIPIIGHGPSLVIDGDVALPPVPGQRARLVPDGIELELSPRLDGGLPPEDRTADRTAEIRAAVRAVRSRIVPDLGAGPVSARDAVAATAGDCTTFALAYAAHAAQRSIPTRVITGLRVSGDRLVRHRWAVSWTGVAWIAVDAAFGAAPAGGDLIGLAMHGADDAGLVAGEAALTQVRSASRR
jgi:hypothetical protein